MVGSKLKPKNKIKREQEPNYIEDVFSIKELYKEVRKNILNMPDIKTSKRIIHTLCCVSKNMNQLLCNNRLQKTYYLNGTNIDAKSLHRKIYTSTTPTSIVNNIVDDNISRRTPWCFMSINGQTCQLIFNDKTVAKALSFKKNYGL